jgi:hypothetical protein
VQRLLWVQFRTPQRPASRTRSLGSSTCRLGRKTTPPQTQEGGFLLPGVIPGEYTLQIERAGFATTQVNGVTLNAGATKNLLIRMKIGAVTEMVNVDASGLTLNRSDATVSTVVDSTLIATVPLNGRSLQDLILLTPGIVTQSPQAATNGRRLLEEQRRNVSSLNPNFGNVSYFPSGLTSSFESLQAEFQRAVSPGIEVLASYTWAHSFDYGSTDPFYPLVRGNSDLDVRQNLEAAVSWTAPPARHRFLSLKRLSEGWGLDGRLIARTGFPVTLLGNFSFDPATGRPYYGGVDLIPGRPLYLHGSQYPGRRMFNGGQNAVDPALVLPAAPMPGDAPRNLLRGFPEVQGNFGIRQTYQLREGLNMQLKIEAFNVFNHPNFGYIDPSFSDLLFGQSSKMLDQSFGNAGALYNQGGPRALQVSVKATF